VNLVLLVEGAQTEPRVYEAWLNRWLPGLRPVQNVADLTTDGYAMVRGRGYPSCYRRIEGLVQDIAEHPGQIDSFWLCLDSDEDSYADRLAEARAAIAEQIQKTRLGSLYPPFDVRVIVQHCCIETWFLGHSRFLRPGPQDPELVRFKRFYDVSADDPEEMPALAGYLTRQSFHLAYLQAMCSERSAPYTKTKPGAVLAPPYFDALQERHGGTGHLQSFGVLLAALRAAGAAL